MFFVDKKMRIENFPKLKRCDHSPKRDKFFYVSLDPPYFSLDSPFKHWFNCGSVDEVQINSYMNLQLWWNIL
jgi:hypothetical protein